ncbi:DNA polymerase III [Candidatus Wolfebacteria bacterium]|nr:DNA polymerase III [Candidatus Wolfebacteria bacterium]
MLNQELAKIFYEIALYLQMDEVAFKPQAYERVGASLENLSQSVDSIYKKEGLMGLEKIPGVGRGIAEKIIEYLENGQIDEHEKLKKKIPVNLEELSAIEGLGPKSIKKLYHKLGVKNREDLESAARKHKIRDLEGFGEKSEERVLKSIEFLKKSKGRFILGFIMPAVREIENQLGRLKETKKIVVAGSVRRRKETIGDVDILIVSDTPRPLMDFFIKMPEVIQVWAHGETKSSIKLQNGLDIDLRVVPEKSYGAALNYFTGSKEHNIALREIAIKKGYKLNEYGLFGYGRGRASRGSTSQILKSIREEVEPRKNWRQIAGTTEEEIYKLLGLDYIEPELRENTGEIEAAKADKLPKLINYSNLQGDLQIQTNWTDGKNSIEEMARAAMEAGLNYIAITDHSKRLAMTGGLDEKKIQKQWQEIDRVNKKLHASGFKFHVLKGSECDILKDGSLDLPDEILSKLDVCGAAIHSYFNLSRKDQTERLKRAMRNPNVDIIFHPTGRKIQSREPYDLDIDEIIKTAKETNTILEVDSYPDRLDLKDEHIRKCVEAGVMLAIDSDAHSVSHLPYLEYGIAQARRGWCEKKDIINTRPLPEMLKLLKDKQE